MSDGDASGALTPKERRLVRLTLAVCTGDWDALRALRAEAPDGEPDREWREAVLQSHLFAGFPRVVEACEVLAAAGGLGALSEDEVRERDRDEIRGSGRALFDRIYARRAETVRGVLTDYHPTLERWIEEHAYGRVLARPGLGAAQRELGAVAALAALDQDRQLASHVRGAVHCGASEDAVRAVLDEVADFATEDTTRRARRVVDRFLTGDRSERS